MFAHQLPLLPIVRLECDSRPFAAHHQCRNNSISTFLRCLSSRQPDRSQRSGPHTFFSRETRDQQSTDAQRRTGLRVGQQTEHSCLHQRRHALAKQSKPQLLTGGDSCTAEAIHQASHIGNVIKRHVVCFPHSASQSLIVLESKEIQTKVAGVHAST